eukprot:Gregarina_sp_Poly_1__1675@NODE_142_length_12956_cov_50_914035_g127_i0_p2_GENE_NODE_142_length_12956_cov_50_914035_g127_i0NODE_142_length_12956_cov_50_914035_g127_i0_p2_ORF_typecomplete_len743_score130_04SBF2/PF12335_8/0_98SBF2/PF12335_8/0_0017FCH/PF00611_23/2_9e05FCH/PF00611_23/8_5e02DUF1759/PF03564_15/7_2DUF1759/PF03564_15/4_6e03DUF1759/PF03564_15/0_93BLOC1S3/PF15753_5/25BLOC1S3/PF15753_5/16_NODE_142_length_12956_cov_50_914035_g127_i030625290
MLSMNKNCKMPCESECIFAETASVHLSFAQVCQTAWKEAAERVENGRHLLDTVRTVIRDLEQLEKQHSVNLRKLANKLELPDTEKSTVEAAVNSFRNDLVNRAHHSMQFAMSIRSDVLDATLEPAIANHATVFNQIKTDALTSLHTVTELKAKHAKALQTVSIAKKAALRATLKAQNPSLTLAQQRVRLHTIALEAAQDANVANAAYHAAVERLNETEANFSKQLNAMLNALEDMDRKRIDCLRDSLMKTYVYRAAQSRNTEYDTNSSISVIKMVDASKDIAEFLKDINGDELNKPPTSSLLPPPAEKVLSWLEIEAYCAEERRSADHPSESTAASMNLSSRNDGSANPASAVRQFFKQTNLDQVVQHAQAGLRELGTTLAGKDDPATAHTKRDRMKQSLKEQANSETLKQLLEDVAQFDIEMSEPPEPPELEVNYETLLELIWESSFELIFSQWGDNGIASIIEGLAVPVNRLQFSQSFLHVASAHKFKLKDMNGFYALCRVCQGLLDYCDSSNDFWCGRIMMLSSHQVYAEGPPYPDPQKAVASWSFPVTESEAIAMQEESLRIVSTAEGSVLPEGTSIIRESSSSISENGLVIWRLSRGIYEHPLWNRVAFWEEAFTLTISEDLQRRIMLEAWKTQNIVHGRKSTDDLDAKERQFKLRNPCCQNLCLFAFHMTSFGIQNSQIRGMIEKSCLKNGLGVDFASQMMECLGQRQEGPPSSRKPSEGLKEAGVISSPIDSIAL